MAYGGNMLSNHRVDSDAIARVTRAR